MTEADGAAPSARWLRDALVLPMQPGRALACGVFDARGVFVPASRTRLSGRRLTGVPDTGAPPRPAAMLKGRHLFAGLGRHHFGHFLLESLGRLWALDGARVDGLIFVPMRGIDLAAVLRRRLGPLLGMFAGDVPAHIVTTPTRVEHLLLPDQGFGHLDLATGTPDFRTFSRRRIAAHLDADPTCDGDLPEKLYVSRRRLRSAAKRVPHETRIERWARRAGYAVFHPERHSIPDQCRHYRAARVILGADGSAFHLAAMAMQPGTRVGLIRRRARPEVFAAIAAQIRAFADTDPWTTDAIAHLSPDTDAADDPQTAAALHELRRSLRRAGFL